MQTKKSEPIPAHNAHMVPDALPLIVLILSWFMRGLVLATLWNWIIVDIFHVSPLSGAQGIGLGFFIHACIARQRKDDRFWLAILIDEALSCFAFLLFGWVITLIM